MPTQLTGLVSHKENELIVASIVEIHSVKSSDHLNGSQGSLMQFLGTWSEFNNSSTARWKVKPTSSSTLISLKSSNLTLIHVPPQEDEKDRWDCGICCSMKIWLSLN